MLLFPLVPPPRLPFHKYSYQTSILSLLTTVVGVVTVITAICWMSLMDVIVTKSGIRHTLSHVTLTATCEIGVIILTLHTRDRRLEWPRWAQQVTEAENKPRWGWHQHQLFLRCHCEPNSHHNYCPLHPRTLSWKDVFSLLSPIVFVSPVEATYCIKLYSIILTDYLYCLSFVPKTYRWVRVNPSSPLGKPFTCMLQFVCTFKSPGHHTPGVWPWTSYLNFLFLADQFK